MLTILDLALYCLADDDAQLAELARALRTEDAPIALAAAVPEPSPPPDDLEAWRAVHWGTPEEVSDAELVVHAQGCLGFRFRCVATPPAAFVEALSRRFPAVTLALFFSGRGGRFGRLRYLRGVAAEKRTERSYRPADVADARAFVHQAIFDAPATVRRAALVERIAREVARQEREEESRG